MMNCLKKSGTWTRNPFGTIWLAEVFPKAELCLMCVHNIPHSLTEHAAVIAKWPKPKELTKKPRLKSGEPRKVATESRIENIRKARARRELRKQVWARP